MRTLQALAAGAGLVMMATAGCSSSDGPDIGGMYRTTGHLIDSRGCGLGTASTTVPFFLLREKDLFGHTYYLLSECTASDEASCETYGAMLDESDGDAWTGKLGFATGSPGSCTYAFTARRAVKAGATLTFEEHAYRLEDQPDSMCDGNQAMELGATMPCVSLDTLVGERMK